MKKIAIFILLGLLLVSAQCFVTVTADVPSLVYSDSFSNNLGWNQQYAGDFTAFILNYELQLNLSGYNDIDEGSLYVPISNWNSLSDTYSIQVDVRVDNTYGNTALILFNYIDNLTHDCFQVDSLGYWRVTRFTNNVKTYESAWSHDLLSSGFNNTVVISQHDNRIDLTFNGVNSKSIYLPSRNETIAVELGINAANGGTVWYDNLYLTRLTN